jgi:hypothetical protein
VRREPLLLIAAVTDPSRDGRDSSGAGRLQPERKNFPADGGLEPGDQEGAGVQEDSRAVSVILQEKYSKKG